MFEPKQENTGQLLLDTIEKCESSSVGSTKKVNVNSRIQTVEKIGRSSLS
jgi:hypothetical protein